MPEGVKTSIRNPGTTYLPNQNLAIPRADPPPPRKRRKSDPLKFKAFLPNLPAPQMLNPTPQTLNDTKPQILLSWLNPKLCECVSRHPKPGVSNPNRIPNCLAKGSRQNRQVRLASRRRGDADPEGQFKTYWEFSSPLRQVGFGASGTSGLYRDFIVLRVFRFEGCL